MSSGGESAPGTAGTPGHGQVLIIDDDEDQRSVLADILESEGFATLVSGTAKETLEILRVETVTVAILDLRLPDVSGTELLGRIRVVDTRVRIIVYTGHGTFASAIEAVNLGAFGYVEKPGEPEAMVRHVHRAAQAWMKEALQESEARYKTLAQLAPVGIFRTTADGSCHYVNESWQRMTGLTPDDVDTVDRWARHVHPEDRGRVAEEWADAVARGHGFRSEYRLRGSGEPLWVVGQVMAETDLQGVVTGFVGTMTDITELRVAREKAEAANRAKSQFLANMNHELRTPINSILGMARFLGEAPLPAEHEEHLGILESAAESLLHLVDVVLDFSKIETEKLVLEQEDFRIADIVEQVRRLLAPTASEAGLDLHVSVDEAVPKDSRGDASRLLQVLLHLVGNAIKFTPRGSVSLTVEPAPPVAESSRDERLDVRFRVRDTGIGMTAEVAARVFEPFFQADVSMTRRFGGMGLGLTFSQRLVQWMGGTLEVESTSAAGSTFTVTLPLAPSAGPAEGAREGARVPRPPGGWHILAVEDEPISQLILSTTVRSLGHRVDTANNGREALEALERESFDLILMDCQMPEIDGYEATRRLRLQEPSRAVPVVAVTAHASSGDRERCLAAGMDDYLTKPYSKEELAAVIERWLAAEL